jgi:hypothetical protein
MFSLKFDLSNLLLGILYLTGLIMDVRVQGACLEILMVTFLLAYEQVLAFIVLSRLSYGLRGLVWSLHGILTIDFCNRRLIPGKWLQFCQKTQKRQLVPLQRSN